MINFVGLSKSMPLFMENPHQYNFSVNKGYHRLRFLLSNIKKKLKLTTPLCLTDEILWRQILERGDQGSVQLLHVDVEMVSVTGSGPYTVRGWNTNSGSLLYEWSIASAKWVWTEWKLFKAICIDIFFV